MIHTCSLAIRNPRCNPLGRGGCQVSYDELKTLGLISNTWAKKYDDYQLEKLNQLAVNFNISAVSKKSGKTKTF